EWVKINGGLSPMEGASLLYREVRRDFLQLERSPPAQTLFVATLVGRRNARLSILAARDPSSVGRRILRVRVPNASSVEFDDQFCSRCIKISDVVANGFLPIELHAKNLFSPQAVP